MEAILNKLADLRKEMEAIRLQHKIYTPVWNNLIRADESLNEARVFIEQAISVMKRSNSNNEG